MPGSTPCRTCGQVNGSDSEFCVRCGEKLPDPAATQVTSSPTAPPEYPWEPPAEWDPGVLPPASGQQETWVGRNPEQAGWNSQPGYNTPAPQPQQPAAKSGSKKPLLIGGGAVVVIAIIVAVILIATGGKKDKDSALNGVQKQTGTDALTSARVALRNAQSVRLTGTVSDSGQKIRLDLELVGDNTQGTLTVNNNDVQIIKIGQTVYIKGDRDFLSKYANGDTAVLDQLDGRWLKAAATSDFDDFSLDGFADQLKPSSDTKVNLKTTQATENGQQVVVLSESDGGTLSIANTGNPYPLSLRPKNASEGQLTFSDYNKAVTITAPTGALDVDAAATPTPTPTPSASPTADSVHAELVGDYACTIDGTSNGGGSLTLNANTTYSEPNGVGGTWQSNGDQVAFTGGYLDGYAGTYDGNDTVHLQGSGGNANVALTCVFQ